MTAFLLNIPGLKLVKSDGPYIRITVEKCKGDDLNEDEKRRNRNAMRRMRRAFARQRRLD